MDDSQDTLPRDLALRWRRYAQERRRYAPDAIADVVDALAAELDAAYRAQDRALLTLDQAALESGYTKDHLGRQVRAGRIPNAGRPHAPRIRRADLPRRAGALRPGAQSAMLYGARGRAVRAVVHPEHGD